ncbi:L-dopachrome tautomerase-related protein [Erythrobacter rubeus]|uniref:Gluconolactonase n=1 Tax=Erythrobacter rubeus TaxID=2760803 RepID=A0ABR8KVR7_9SPHN|nr:L-dopachrome tautomerase-related protein [Erythrobacter rubeus]MBD2843298.1 hypothetical protein [Erythrobacter rubeus]
MRFLNRFAFAAALIVASMSTLVISAPGAAQDAGSDRVIEIVAEFEDGPGNVTVSPDGRIFLSMHQFYDPQFRVMELLPDGSTTPFPNEQWSGPRGEDGTADVGLTAVLGLRSDSNGVIWLLDNGGGDPTKARLVGWDSRSDEMAAFLDVPAAASIEGSFHNDLAIDEERGVVYLADIAGRIGVVDLETGEGWRWLDGSPVADADDVDFVVRGEVLTDPDGEPVRTKLNPITISPDGEWVYFGSMNGLSVYRVPAGLLADRNSSADAIEAAVERYGDKSPSDGITIDNAGNVYVTDGGGNAIGITRPDGSYETLIVDRRIEWPDGMSTGPDGYIYATVNRLNNAPPLNGGKMTEPSEPYYLIRFRPIAPVTQGR